MTDEKLNELEAACNVNVNGDGEVSLKSGDVLELVSELRELRKHAADLCAHEGTIASLQRLLAKLGSYASSPCDVGVMSGSGRIPIQDPGR